MKRILPIIFIIPMLSGCVTLNREGLLITNNFAEKNKIDTGKVRTLDAIDLGFDKKVNDGKINTSFGNISYSYVSSERDVPLVVFCGGNAFRQDKSGGYYLPSLGKIGDVFMFDYPGLGQSDGNATKTEFNETLNNVHNKIMEISANRKNKQIIYYGLSFGGGVCSDFANKNPQAIATILAGTFADYRDVANARYPVIGNMVKINVAPDAPEYKIPPALKNYQNPVIVIASKTDTTIPVSASINLYKKLQKQGNKTTLITLEDAQHSRIPADKNLEPKLTHELQKLLPPE